MIYLGADHGGFKLKEKIKKFFDQQKISYQDLGNFIYDPDDDYPDFAYKVAKRVAKESGSRGILICRTGQGMACVANKVKGIFASNVWDETTAKTAAAHGHVQIITLGADIINQNKALKLIKIWLNTLPDNDRRHLRRLSKIKRISEKEFK